MSEAAIVALDRRWQAGVGAVTVGWLLFALILLIRSTTPDLGLPGSRSEHLVIGSVLGFVIAGLLAALGRRPVASMAWLATVAGVVAVTLFESVQVLVPVRAFELEDLVYSVAGIVAGVAVAATLSARRGSLLPKLVAVLGAAGLVVGVAAAVVRDGPPATAQEIKTEFHSH